MAAFGDLRAERFVQLLEKSDRILRAQAAKVASGDNDANETAGLNVRDLTDLCQMLRDVGLGNDAERLVAEWKVTFKHVGDNMVAGLLNATDDDSERAKIIQKLGPIPKWPADEAFHENRRLILVGRLTELSDRLVEILTIARQALEEGAKSAEGQTTPTADAAGNESGNLGGDLPEGMTWQEAAKRLQMLRKLGDPFTSQAKLADQIGCAASTINKAIQKTLDLQQWAKVDKPNVPSAQALNAVILDSHADHREGNPADYLPDDEVDIAFQHLIEQAEPNERAKLHAMPRDQRRELAKLTANDPDRTNRVYRKP